METRSLKNSQNQCINNNVLTSLWGELIKRCITKDFNKNS